jgi:hypothetical protein
LRDDPPREIGARYDEAYALTDIGTAHTALGDHQITLGQHDRALAISAEIGSPEMEADILNNLRLSLLAAGRHDEALGRHRAALALGEEGDVTQQQARAHDGIARALARTHWELALTLYDPKSPEAASIRAALATPS